MMRLPHDVCEHVGSRIRRRVILCLVFTSLMLIFIAFLGERVFSGMGYVCQYTAYALLILFPSFHFKIWRVFTDKDRSGEIVSVTVKTRYENHWLERARTHTAYVNVVILGVRWNDGGTEELEINEGEKKPEHFLGEYKVGFSVYRFRGLTKELIVDPERDDLSYCPVCGGRDSSKQPRCKNCGHTMIRGPEFKK